MVYLLVVLTIVLLNIAAVYIIYKIVNKLEKMDIIIFIAAGVTVLYLLVSLIYLISDIGLNVKLDDSMKNLLIFTFVPINAILFLIFIAKKYISLKTKKISKEDFIKIVVKVSLVGLIAITIECFLLRQIKVSIADWYEGARVEAEKMVNEMVENEINANEINVNENKINSSTNETTDNSNKTKTYQDFLNNTNKNTNTEDEPVKTNSVEN